MGSSKLLSIELSKYVIPVRGVKVLVVDGDSACRAIVSRMLQILGYEVTTAALASDALSIVQDPKNEFHLVLMEVHLPDMGRKEIIKKMKEKCQLPFFFMSADAREFCMVEALCEGAKLYFVKPVMIADISGLWQFAIWNSKNKTIACSFHPKPMACGDSEWDQSEKSAGSQSLQNAKRKGKELCKKDEEGKSFESLVPKKPRITWTYGLHYKSPKAIRMPGINGFLQEGQRKEIHQHMNVPGLRKEDVSSYLQWKEDAFWKYVSRNSSGSNLGSDYPPEINNHNETCLPSLGQKYETNQPGFSSTYPKDFGSCMPVNFLSHAHFPFQEILSDHKLSDLILPYNKQGFVQNTSGPGEHNGEALSGFRQAENATSGKFFGEGVFLSIGDYPGGGNTLHYSTLPANYMHQQIPLQPLIPVPLPPSEEREHNSSETEVGNTDDLLGIPEGHQEFEDEDFALWLKNLWSS